MTHPHISKEDFRVLKHHLSGLSDLISNSGNEDAQEILLILLATLEHEAERITE